MMIPPEVLTTAQFLSSLVSFAKSASDLAKKSTNHALKSAVSDLYSAVIEAKAIVLNLDEENRRLKAELARKDEFLGPIEPHNYFFFKEKPNQPLCPKCFQSQPPNPVFLSPLTDLDGGKYRSCLICGYENYETPRNYSNPVAVGRSSLFHGTRSYS
ncbi:MAG: hypothetical protein ACLQGT_09970 [Terracidiphilus sp.]